MTDISYEQPYSLIAIYFNSVYLLLYLYNETLFKFIDILLIFSITYFLDLYIFYMCNNTWRLDDL